MSALAKSVFEYLKENKHVLVTAESCTGGMIAKTITDFAGSSSIFDRGFVTYSNNSKIDMLGVTPETLKEHGAVAAQTAHEMANGALQNSSGTLSISVTGIAGPTGGSEEKPVGLVYIGLSQLNGKTITQKCNFDGDRHEVRLQTMDAVFNLILQSE